MNESDRPVWLITGAAGALGSALVRQLMHDGAECVALDRDASGLNELHDLGRAPALMPMDLAGATPEDYERLAATIEQTFGRVDVLVHNAAFFEALRPLLQTQPGEWMRILQTGVTGPFMLTSVLAPLMNARSRIVWIEDGHCLQQQAGWGAFGVAQAARAQMARILQSERASSSPRVVTIDPGPFYSKLRVAAWPSDSPDDLPAVEGVAQRVIEAVRQGESH